jgi:hypothetical protein
MDGSPPLMRSPSPTVVSWLMKYPARRRWGGANGFWREDGDGLRKAAFVYVHVGLRRDCGLV